MLCVRETQRRTQPEKCKSYWEEKKLRDGAFFSVPISRLYKKRYQAFVENQNIPYPIAKISKNSMKTLEGLY